MCIRDSARWTRPFASRRTSFESSKCFQANVDQYWNSNGETQTAPLAAVHSHKTSEQIPIDLLSKGDFIEIRSGELIPADGIIVEGKGALNKAPLTGESVPVDVTEGDLIQAGLVLARGPVVVKVEAVGEGCLLYTSPSPRDATLSRMPSSA